ncbi:MAG: hypothetical protein HO274_02545 [Ferrovum myxofaciens]|uniref:hypothetical protein n=1 Tax=Ferrovum myxofaciens TaxID=416213 RepID=UPI002352579C|nr:hypothetical protein [Ferrovum myxofaciens]QKE40332.1 MAG: hypothetical protein HO274_02545 [Ferrovum myxofaciens]
MIEIVIPHLKMQDLSVEQIASLSHHHLQELHVSLAELTTWVERAHETLDAALEQRFGEKGREVLRESNRDFGVVHFSDGPLRVTYEVPEEQFAQTRPIKPIKASFRLALIGEDA